MTDQILCNLFTVFLFLVVPPFLILYIYIFLHLQVTFEQHKENLSRMFRQYQQQESSSSQNTVRTVSGVSQSSETTKSVNGPPTAEMAPSTVIELTVDKLSQISIDSASSSTNTSRPLEVEEDRGQTSITVSNILARTEDEGQKAVAVEEAESSKDHLDVEKETEATSAQKNNAEEQSEDTEKEKALTEVAAEKSSVDVKMADHNQFATTDTKTEEVDGDSAKSTSDDAETVDEKSVEHTTREASNSATENSLNEKVPEKGDTPHQMLTEPETSQDNSVVGGASVFSEDLFDASSVSDQIHTSDTNDSQEESSFISATTGEEGEVVKKEQDKPGDEDDVGDHQQESRVETEMQDVEVKETEESKSEEKPVSSLDSPTPQAETPEENVTEPPKENVSDQQSFSSAEGVAADQQSSDTQTSPSVQEAAAASDSASLNQPSETSGTGAGETPAGASDGVITTASSPDTHKKTDSVSKTKEIKIARLDVSNVALDTERLELKATSTTVSIYFLFKPKTSLLLVSLHFTVFVFVSICRKQAKAKHQ